VQIVSATLDRPIEISQIELLDCTLREGSYAVNFELDEKFVTELLSRLNETSLRKIEIGHGIGLEAERAGLQPCNITHYQWCEIACSTLTNKSWGMFAQPEFTQPGTVAKLCDQGMSFVRVGIEPDRVPENVGYLQQVTKVCEHVYLNLMKSSATPVDRLLQLLDKVDPVSLAGLYVVDSYGAMLPSDVREYVTALKERFQVVGFHCHDNLGLATMNSIAAIEAGATIVDGTLNGIGRGAGNAAIESLAGIINILGADRFDYKKLAKLAEFCRVSMEVVPTNREMEVLGGVIGIHSGQFPLIEELCTEYGLDPGHLMEVAVDLAPHNPPRKSDLLAAAQQIADHSEGQREHRADQAGAVGIQ
jgi:isopropylmalate/homocitrate/citramalate synthase